MTNMAQTRADVEQFLTEIPQDVRSSALLIALLEKIGFTDTKTLSKLSRVSERMVRHARQQVATPAAMDCQSSGNGLPKAETDCHERQPIAATATDCRPHVRGRAHFELPSEVSYSKRDSEPPFTPHQDEPEKRVSGRQIWSDLMKPKDASLAYDGGVQFDGERITLVNGTHAKWLADFDGDAERLNLALIAAAPYVQANSSRTVKVQVEAQLARQLADKRDRDKRYQATKTAAKPAGGIRDAIARHRARQASEAVQ